MGPMYLRGSKRALPSWSLNESQILTKTSAKREATQSYKAEAGVVMRVMTGTIEMRRKRS